MYKWLCPSDLSAGPSFATRSHSISSRDGELHKRMRNCIISFVTGKKQVTLNGLLSNFSPVDDVLAVVLWIMIVVQFVSAYI